MGGRAHLGHERVGIRGKRLRGSSSRDGDRDHDGDRRERDEVGDQPRNTAATTEPDRCEPTEIHPTLPLPSLRRRRQPPECLMSLPAPGTNWEDRHRG